MVTQNEAAKLKSLSVRFPQRQAFPFIVLESIFFLFLATAERNGPSASITRVLCLLGYLDGRIRSSHAFISGAVCRACAAVTIKTKGRQLSSLVGY